MKEAGAAANDVHRMQAWAGQSAALAKPIPAGDLVRQIWDEAQALLGVSAIATAAHGFGSCFR